MWVPHVSGEREECRIRSGYLCLFTASIHAGRGMWIVTSAKVENLLAQTLNIGKNVEAILKLLSQGVAFLTVATN
jgi:hypothetical protein